MIHCLLCGDRAFGSNDEVVVNEDYLSIVKFFVWILVEVGHEFDEFLSISQVQKWWFTCENCKQSINESFLVYNQLVQLAETLREQQKELVNKLRRCYQSASSDGYSSRGSRRSKFNRVAKQFREELLARNWDEFNFSKIPKVLRLEDYCGEGFVKDEVDSDGAEAVENVTPTFCLPYVIKNEAEDEILTTEGNSFSPTPSITWVETDKNLISDILEKQSEDTEEIAAIDVNDLRRRAELPDDPGKDAHLQVYKQNKGKGISSEESSDESFQINESELDGEYNDSSEEYNSHDATASDSYQESEALPSRRSNPSSARTKTKNYPKSQRKPLALPDRQVNPSTDLFHCPSCDFKSERNSSVRLHYRRFHLKEVNEVKYTNKHTNLSNNNQRRRGRNAIVLPDLSADPTTGMYRCPLCNVSLMHSNSLRNHYRRTHLKEKIVAKSRREKAELRRKRKEKRLENEAKQLREQNLPDLKVDPSTNKIHCPSCDYSSTYKRFVLGHYTRVHLNTTREESAKFDSRLKRFPNLILPDLEKDPVTDKYPCPSCDFSGNERVRVRIHYKRRHLMIKQFVCSWPDCGRKFSCRGNYNGHVDRHKGTPRFKCSECPLAFYTKNPLVRHRQRDHEGGLESRHFVCDQCGNTFTNSDYLQNHKSLIHNRRQEVICDVCGVTQINRLSLRQHKAEVHGIQPEKCVTVGIVEETVCELCGKRMQKKNLNGHMRNIHNDLSFSDKWSCSECPATFKSKHALKVHLYGKHKIGDPIKTKFVTEAKFSCDVSGCRRRFKYEKQFKTHMEEIHGPDKNKPGQFECQFCGKRFFWKMKFQQHEEIHKNAESKPFSCETCGKSFTTKRYLNYHLVYTHKVQLENRKGKRPSM